MADVLQQISDACWKQLLSADIGPKDTSSQALLSASQTAGYRVLSTCSK